MHGEIVWVTMSARWQEAPYESPPTDLVVTEARIIGKTEIRRLRAGKKVIDLSGGNMLYVPAQNGSGVHEAALGGNIGAGQPSEIVGPNKATDLLALGAVIVGSALVNSVLDAILHRPPNRSHGQPQ